MKPDPAIENIRTVRRQISEKFGNDPARLIAHYIEYQKQFGDRLLDAPPTGEEKRPWDAAEQRVAPDPPREA